MKKYYTSKYDIVFKSIFCDQENPETHEGIFISHLKKKIKTLEFLRSELNVTNVLERNKTVDVLALVDKEYIHIEMNAGFNKYLHYRNFNYFTSIYNKKNKKGETIDTLIQFIHIDFTYGLPKDYHEITEYRVFSKDQKKNTFLISKSSNTIWTK